MAAAATIYVVIMLQFDIAAYKREGRAFDENRTRSGHSLL